MNTFLKVLTGVTLLALVACPMIGLAQTPPPAAGTPAAGTPAAAPTPEPFPSPSELPSWSISEVTGLVGKIINWIFTFLMIFVVVMVIMAGFMFVTGGGNPDNVTKARNMLMFALVGFAVGMLAKGIIVLVESFIGKSVTKPFGL